jgi:hypothetical protein
MAALWFVVLLSLWLALFLSTLTYVPHKPGRPTLEQVQSNEKWTPPKTPTALDPTWRANLPR